MRRGRGPIPGFYAAPALNQSDTEFARSYTERSLVCPCLFYRSIIFSMVVGRMV
jgi:hypothetical protein